MPPTNLLDTLRAAHPRLIFTVETEAVLRQRLAADPLAAAFVDALRRRSDHFAGLPPVPWEPVPFNEFGVQILELNRALLNRITNHAFLYRLDREDKYVARVWRELDTALAFPHWNPALFLDTAEMLVAVSFAYDWLYEAWTPAQRATLRAAMVARGLRPGLEIHETRRGTSAMFVESTSNWNSVCNAGLLAGALAVAEDEPDLASRIVQHALTSLLHAQRGYEPDGASEEGATYWSYGTEFFCLAGSILQSALGNGHGLLDTEALRGTTRYRLHVQGPNGRNFSYADCWPRASASFAYCLLAGRHGPAPARRHCRTLAEEYLTEGDPDEGRRLSPLIALFLPPDEAAADAGAASLDAFFGGKAQLAMLRSAWDDPRAAYVGFKAGHANANHSHLDLGSFLFDCGGVRWSADLGPDRYVLPGYFRHEQNRNLPLTHETEHLPNRWTYLRNNNRGHSTLTLGNELQSRTAVAPFVARGSTPALGYAVADLSGCYPAYARRWQRGVALVDRSWVSVRDELSGLLPGTLLEWVLITEAEVIVADDGKSATLHKDAETLTLTLAAAPAGKLTAAPARSCTAVENQNEGVNRVLFRWIADTADAVLEVHLVPAAGGAAGRVLGALGNWG